MSSVSRTDQNNNTYQLNKLQITLEEAKTLGLSLLGLSETHHFKFPANVREFSSESEESSVGGASLVILDETITVLPQNVYNRIQFSSCSSDQEWDSVPYLSGLPSSGFGEG